MSQRRYLITAPTQEVVSLEMAKAHLRVTTTDQDDLIQLVIDAAVAQLDPASGGWLGRALRPQTWEVRYDGFPVWYCEDYYYDNYRSAAIALPYPPLISIESVKYDDGNGTEQTLVEGTGYRVIGLGSIQKSYIAPIYGGLWPSSVRCDPESVRIRFTSGYELATIDTMPATIRQAVLLMVKHLYGLGERNLFVSAETVDGVGSRNFIVSENAAMVMRNASEGLLGPYRMFE
jgi:uncharacterized phiE125 gp8 family phage protein